MSGTAKAHWSKLLTPMTTQIEQLQEENERLKKLSEGGNNDELLQKVKALEDGALLTAGANVRLQKSLDDVTQERDELALKVGVLEKQNQGLGDALREANKKNEELEAALKATDKEEKPKAQKKK